LQRVLPAPELEKLAFPLKAGALLNRDNLLRWMNDQGYERMETVREPGQYAVRGGLLDLFAPAGIRPCAWTFSERSWNGCGALTR
jgi:transcription-repair coupling factor (superfamily II helicase)